MCGIGMLIRGRKEQYDSMLLKCLALINGKALEQYEVVKPVVILTKYGPAATRYPGRIRRKINPFAAASSSHTAAAAAAVEGGQRRVY